MNFKNDVMKINSLKEINENHLAIVLTFVLFFLLFLLKVQEEKSTMEITISNTLVELVSADN
jgi:hypothetical protein